MPANWNRCWREHLVALAGHTELLAGIGGQAFIDIDSLLRPVHEQAMVRPGPSRSGL